MWLLIFYKAISRESVSQVSLSHNEQAQKIKMSNNIELTLSSALWCVHRAHTLCKIIDLVWDDEGTESLLGESLTFHV